MVSPSPNPDAAAEIQALSTLIPPYKDAISPPIPLLTRLWALIDVPKDSGEFAYVESLYETTQDPLTRWTIVVADQTHIVHLQASVPMHFWTRGEQSGESYQRLVNDETDIDVSARRLRLADVTEITLAGDFRDWLVWDGGASRPRWELRWIDGTAIRVPLEDIRLSARARRLVLSLNPCNKARQAVTTSSAIV
jgi:hypothetical protein